ncbi:MAG: FAD binding domain-containing protein [Anaerolineales bacterium]|nr:FAD binding domain-containing protein [Anaerolineales bacterium]
MITAYHRPQTLDEALELLSRPNTQPLGGGTLLSHANIDSVEAVDLQSLNLDSIARKGNDLELGATLTLQGFLESADCPEALKAAIKLEAPINIRNMATIAGTLVAADGRSTFATALLAMDAKITVVSEQSSVFSVGEFLLTHPRGLITQIAIPLNAKFAFEYVSKTPSDTPLVCVALAQWNSGRARLALGGYGKTPLLAMDGTEADGLDAAARNAYHEANDEWASAEYRMDVAATLAKRCLAGAA